MYPSLSYEIDGTSVGTGVYSESATVTFTGTGVRYTTDGTEPTATTGTQGTSVTVSETCTIKAIAVSTEWALCSDVVEIEIIIQKVSEEGTTTTTTPPTTESVVMPDGTTTTVTKTETTEVNANTNTTTTTTELSTEGVTTQATVVEKPGEEAEKTITTTIDSTTDVNASINMAVAQINKANENTTAGTDVKVEIVIDTKDDAKEIAISKDAIAAVAGNDSAALTVSNKDVAVTLDNATLKGLASGDVKVDVKKANVSTLTAAQQDVVKDNIVVSIKVTDSNGYVDELNGKAQIKIPLTSETADHDVYFVDIDGDLVKMKEIERTSTYIIVETDHFSEYVLMSASSVPSVPPIFIPMPDDDFIPPMQIVKQDDDNSTGIACIAAGAVAAMLAIILIATSRGKL